VIEVLTASWIQLLGEWQTDMFFYNVTASSVSFTCSWTYHLPMVNFVPVGMVTGMPSR
jgi:hypothetical protein